MRVRFSLGTPRKAGRILIRMDSELKTRLDAIEQKLDATYHSAEKTRKYILWTVIITVAFIVIPLVLLPFAAGSLLSSYSDTLNF